jgi:hypothetical protein
VIRGYFDESWKDNRVFAIGGYVCHDRLWRRISADWKHRRLKDGIQCFHAADCEDGRGEFSHLTKDRRIQLKTDLIEIVSADSELGGFGTAVIIEDFKKVRESSDRAKKVLGPSPYYLCFQTLFSDVAIETEKVASDKPGVRVTSVFEQQEEFSGRAKKLYDEFKSINLTYAPRLSVLTYASKKKFVALEMADNLAYETMKEILNNKYDPTRPRRISMQRMLANVCRVTRWTEKELRQLVLVGRTAEDVRRDGIEAKGSC